MNKIDDAIFFIAEAFKDNSGKCFFNKITYRIIRLPRKEFISPELFKFEIRELNTKPLEYIEIQPLISDKLMYTLIQQFYVHIGNLNRKTSMNSEIREKLFDFIEKKLPLNDFYEIIEIYAVYRIEWSDFYDKYFELKAKKWFIKNRSA
jgi:hypothetical protein